MIFSIHIYQVKTAPACYPLELLLLNELYRESLCCALNISYTLRDILMIFDIHKYQVKTVYLVQ